jgi:4-amino-4-deoxy-L-arabinose transferase
MPAILLGGGLWSFFGFKMILEKRLIHPKIFLKYLGGRTYGSFLSIWFLVPLAIFFLVKSRLPLYILPLYAPIALALAHWIGIRSKEQGSLRNLVLVGFISALFIIGAKGFVAYYPSKNNMRSLYRMCQDVKREHLKFAVFKEPALYGLQFYLKGDLKRISPAGDESWADGSVENILHEINGTLAPDSYVIISKTENVPTLLEILETSGIPFRQFGNKNWMLYVMEGKQCS